MLTDFHCRAISFVERAGQTNCRRLDQVEQLGNPLTIPPSTETLRLDPETQGGGLGFVNPPIQPLLTDPLSQ